MKNCEFYSPKNSEFTHSFFEGLKCGNQLLPGSYQLLHGSYQLLLAPPPPVRPPPPER